MVSSEPEIKLVKKFQLSELRRYEDFLRSGEHFALARFADGERLFIEGREAKGIDGWVSPKGPSTLGQSLKEALSIAVTHQCHIGVSDDINDPSSKLFYLNMISSLRQEKITMSNIFVNGAYDTFVNSTIPLINNSFKHILLFCNKNASPCGIKKIFDDFHIYLGPSDCVAFWERASFRWLSHVQSLARSYQDTVFLFALGPVSSISIPHMYAANKNNTYIDIGSALDPFLFGRYTRPYQVPGNQDREQLVYIEVQDNIQFLPAPATVSCILNCYKRYDLVFSWLSQIKVQTLYPSEIHILFNTEPPPELLAELRKDTSLTNILISDANLGVWNRFAYALNTKTEFVCIFDDDTIPGCRWLENCYQSFQAQPGVYGTVGLIIHDRDNYMSHTRYGWPSANPSTVQVDLVGHSWFFKRDWLSSYWKDLPPVSGFDFMGEDMHISYAVQRYLGIATFVPPHPPDNQEIWGSTMPQRGVDLNAISMTGKASKMNYALKRLFDLGWTTIADNNNHLQ